MEQQVSLTLQEPQKVRLTEQTSIIMLQLISMDMDTDTGMMVGIANVSKGLKILDLGSV